MFRGMRLRYLPLWWACACGAPLSRAPHDHVVTGLVAAPAPTPAGPPLRAPGDFEGIKPLEARSVALFGEVATVLGSPRCANCHPMDDTPRQRDGHELHEPPVSRGPDDRGVPGAECASCHQDANLPLAPVPGAPGWHLAPRSMGWLGQSPGQICAALTDRARNGDRDLEQLAEHLAHDPLVAWGWAPGAGRTPAPGSQAALGELFRAWIDTGAVCPPVLAGSGEEQR
jgi:hypothetical protein